MSHTPPACLAGRRRSPPVQPGPSSAFERSPAAAPARDGIRSGDLYRYVGPQGELARAGPDRVLKPEDRDAGRAKRRISPPSRKQPVRARRRALPRERPRLSKSTCWRFTSAARAAAAADATTCHDSIPSRPDTEGLQHPPPRRTRFPGHPAAWSCTIRSRSRRTASRRRDLTGAAELNRACDDDGDGVQDHACGAYGRRSLVPSEAV